MTDPRPGDEGGQFPQDQYRDPEAQLGGADAVEKTTYVKGQGADPEGRGAPGEPTARTPARGGRNPVVWLVVAIVVLLIVVYLGAMLR